MKKVLIISYYWPPAGGPGVQRWLKFVKYLPDYGIQPVLYLPENPHYPLRDPSLLEEVPKEVEILRRPILEPYSLARIFSPRQTDQISSGIIPESTKQGLLQRFMLFIRGNFFIPDARRWWVTPSVRFLEPLIKEKGFDALITTGPPHSLHLIGKRLKEKTGISWIADFRDPWTQIGYHKELKLLKGAQQKHLELEKQVLQGADQIITTSFTTREEFQKKTGVPIEVITNGYDEEPPLKPSLDTTFTLAHIGSLLSARNPANLWQALGELVREKKDFAADFELRLVGTVGEPVLESIREHGLEQHLTVQQYVSHEKALAYQRQSQVLLLIEIDSPQTRGIIPGKLFEYINSGRPILALGPQQADFSKILLETHTGSFFLYGQKKEIKDWILERFTEYKRGTLQVHPVGVARYSRKNLTGQLAELLKNL